MDVDSLERLGIVCLEALEDEHNTVPVHIFQAETGHIKHNHALLDGGRAEETHILHGQDDKLLQRLGLLRTRQVARHMDKVDGKFVRVCVALDVRDAAAKLVQEAWHILQALLTLEQDRFGLDI